jgi:molybdopterin synthase catalytic subunit
MSRPPTTLRVLLFAGLKQRVGRESVELSVEGEITAARLLERLGEQFPEIASQLPHCRVAADHTFVRSTETIDPDVELAVIPPVSGGHDGRSEQEFRQDACVLTNRALLPSTVREAVEHPGAGAVTSFIGNVRAHSRGKTITHLEYEAYGPMAVRVMAEIAGAIEARIDGTRVAIHHRIGHLEVGEAAVIIAASAPHRAEAFEACRAAIETLKQDVPIWKKEVADDGAEWIGRGP